MGVVSSLDGDAVVGGRRVQEEDVVRQSVAADLDGLAMASQAPPSASGAEQEDSPKVSEKYHIHIRLSVEPTGWYLGISAVLAISGVGPCPHNRRQHEDGVPWRRVGCV